VCSHDSTSPVYPSVSAPPLLIFTARTTPPNHQIERVSSQLDHPVSHQTHAVEDIYMRGNVGARFLILDRLFHHFRARQAGYALSLYKVGAIPAPTTQRYTHRWAMRKLLQSTWAWYADVPCPSYAGLVPAWRTWISWRYSVDRVRAGAIRLFTDGSPKLADSFNLPILRACFFNFPVVFEPFLAKLTIFGP
jgi:hypothetical protein